MRILAYIACAAAVAVVGVIVWFFLALRKQK